MIETIKYFGDFVEILDQTRLPDEEVYIKCEDFKDVAKAIKEMKIRGAPAIGVAAAFGITLGIWKLNSSKNLDEDFNKICKTFSLTRPTAVNLFWAIERMKKVFKLYKNYGLSILKEKLKEEAQKIKEEDILKIKK